MHVLSDNDLNNIISHERKWHDDEIGEATKPWNMLCANSENHRRKINFAESVHDISAYLQGCCSCVLLRSPLDPAALWTKALDEGGPRCTALWAV